MSSESWSVILFHDLLLTDPLGAVDYLLQRRRDGTLDAKEAVREMYRTGVLSDFAVLVVRDAIAHDPQKASLPLFELMLGGIGASAQKPLLQAPPRVAELVHRVASGASLSPEDRQELVALISALE